MSLPIMPTFHTELLSVLSEQSARLPALKELWGKYELSLFMSLTPASITSLEAYVRNNPQVAIEAMSLLESAQILSLFYSEGQDLCEHLKRIIVRVRNVNAVVSLQPEMMGEFFVTSEQEMITLLESNPLYLGIYLYVFLTALIGPRG